MAYNEKPKPCPFCGEIPLLDKDSNEIHHACHVLNRQLTFGRNAWNNRKVPEAVTRELAEYLGLFAAMDLRWLENEYDRTDMGHLEPYKNRTVAEIAERYAYIVSVIREASPHEEI